MGALVQVEYYDVHAKKLCQCSITFYIHLQCRLLLALLYVCWVLLMNFLVCWVLLMVAFHLRQVWAQVPTLPVKFRLNLTLWSFIIIYLPENLKSSKIFKCGLPPAEGQKRRKTIFLHAAGSTDLSAWGVSGHVRSSRFTLRLPSNIAWHPPTHPPMHGVFLGLV